MNELLRLAQFEAAQALLDATGPDLLHPTDTMSPLEAFANGANRFDVVDWLIEQGADINYCTSSGGGPLIHAIGDAAVEMVAYLLARGADVNRPNMRGVTPITSFVECVTFCLADCQDLLGDYRQMLDILMPYGMNLDRLPDVSWSPLHQIITFYASHVTYGWGRIEAYEAIIRVMLGAGATVQPALSERDRSALSAIGLL